MLQWNPFFGSLTITGTVKTFHVNRTKQSAPGSPAMQSILEFETRQHGRCVFSYGRL